MKSIQARQFAPIYILMGEESYFIDQLCDALTNGILPEEEREFNQFVLYGIDTTGQQLADMAREFPMMSEYKVIIVKEAQNVKGAEALERYFEKPSPQTIFVYCYKNGKIDRRKKYVTLAAKNGVVFESQKVSDKDLPRFVEEFVAERGATIDSRTAATIAASIGQDLCRMATELDKLCLALPPESNKKISSTLVEECIGVSREYNAFEFRSAIVARDAAKASRIAHYFDKNPKSGGVFILLPTIFNYFQMLMLAWYAPNRNNENAIAQHLELRNAWSAREYMTGLRNYKPRKTMEIIAKIRETDEKVKGLNNNSASTGDLMQELIYFITH